MARRKNNMLQDTLVSKNGTETIQDALLKIKEIKDEYAVAFTEKAFVIHVMIVRKGSLKDIKDRPMTIGEKRKVAKIIIHNAKLAWMRGNPTFAYLSTLRIEFFDLIKQVNSDRKLKRAPISFLNMFKKLLEDWVKEIEKSL